MYTSIAGISIEPTSMTGSTPYSSSGGATGWGRTTGAVVVVEVVDVVDVGVVVVDPARVDVVRPVGGGGRRGRRGRGVDGRFVGASASDQPHRRERSGCQHGSGAPHPCSPAPVAVYRHRIDHPTPPICLLSRRWAIRCACRTHAG